MGFGDGNGDGLLIDASGKYALHNGGRLGLLVDIDRHPIDFDGVVGLRGLEDLVDHCELFSDQVVEF